jgi:hypothetical protein
MGLSLVVAAPSSASTVTPGLGTLTPFTGGDPGEGLDLGGDFAYALDSGNTTPGNVVVGGATFVPASGGTPPDGVTGASNDFRYSTGAPPFVVDYGNSANDSNLENVVDTVWFGSDFSHGLSVTPGTTYKLQFIFQESFSAFHGTPNRNFDVLHETPDSPNTPVLAIDNLVQSQETTTSQGLVYTYQFTAPDSTFSFRLTDNPGDDGNAILGALTLEVVPEPSSLALLAAGALAVTYRRPRRASKP